MSEPDDALREWQPYIEDMIGFCERVRDYTAGLDKAAFVASPMSYDATLRNLKLIGEAATRIPETVRDAQRVSPRRAIVGMRNRLAPACLHIDVDIIWTLIVDAVPELLAALRKLRETAGKERGLTVRRRNEPRSVETLTRGEAAWRTLTLAVSSAPARTSAAGALGSPRIASSSSASRRCTVFSPSFNRALRAANSTIGARASASSPAALAAPIRRDLAFRSVRAARAAGG